MTNLVPIYPRETTAKQPTSEVITDIRFEFKRLKLVAKVKCIGHHACVEILQDDGRITFSHEATKLLSLLQMYDPKATTTN
jgi:hypothetical protein